MRSSMTTSKKHLVTFATKICCIINFASISIVKAQQEFVITPQGEDALDGCPIWMQVTVEERQHRVRRQLEFRFSDS